MSLSILALADWLSDLYYSCVRARSVAVRGTSRPAVDNFVRQRFTAGEFLLPAACVGATWADFVRNYMDAWVIEAFNKRPQAGR